MNDDTVLYVHQEARTLTKVRVDGGTVSLSLGLDTPRGWDSITARIGADDARHLAAALLRAADAA